MYYCRKTQARRRYDSFSNPFTRAHNSPRHNIEELQVSTYDSLHRENFGPENVRDRNDIRPISPLAGLNAS